VSSIRQSPILSCCQVEIILVCKKSSTELLSMLVQQAITNWLTASSVDVTFLKSECVFDILMGW